MAHYALIENDIVVTVLVANDISDCGEGEWIQTSYNTREGKHYDNTMAEDSKPALRKNFAGIGFSYDSTRDAFIPPKPYDSWVLNEETCVWDAPTLVPTTPKKWIWDEDTTSWKEFIKE